jgi:hypothetical protein
MRAALVLSLLVVACRGSTPAPVGPKPVPVGPDPQTQVLTPAQVAGFWTGNWGQLVLRDQGGKLVGAYTHDKGTVSGALRGDTFVGWWCETPSRQPSNDAGDVELTFVTKPDGSREIDGRWRYGTEGEFREDWDLTWNTGQPPAELVARFDDAAAFCAKP